MKKLLFVSFIFLHFAMKAQVPTQIINTPGPKYVFVGSLVMADNSSANSQKIIVKILGGGWFNDSNGETNYYISNRAGLSIRQVSLGGSVTTQIPLKAYQNETNIDFYIVPDVNVHSSFAVSSFSYGHGLTPQYVNITEQTAVPVGTDITSIVQINPVITTDGAGRVGIGTITPSEALSVKGKIRAQEIKVELTNWPDYVFADDYKKTSLEDLEKYIRLNKHLPEMPSAKEVEKNGIELGDINKKLLKQQEEFVLHLIEKDKEIKALKKDNEAIRSKLDEIITLLNKNKKKIKYLKTQRK